MTIERALELLPQMRDSEWITALGQKTAMYTDEAKEAFNMAISALEKQEQDRWIPVKENPKKPERIFDTYQVYTKYERFGIADYFGGGGWSGYDVDGDQIDELEIAAWRPLPGPYTEEKA